MLNKLFFIKSFHSIIFFFMVACLVYILYAGVTRTFNQFLLIAIGAILFEGAALVLNKWQCPLTTLAKKYGAEKGSVADIFLPAIVARITFKWSTALFVAELILLGIRYFIG